VRRFYGDRRIKGAFVRKGYLEWANAGFPREPSSGRPPAEHFRRGQDEWVKLPWDEAFTLVARATVDIATTYTGADGQARLQAQGYDEAMVAKHAGVGTQVLKIRGGMPFLGATRLMGFYRFANMLALLDAQLRGVGPDAAVGGRVWDSYTWHTDLPPGHPLVTGQQTVEFDLFTAENASLITLWGMNWICTKTSPTTGRRRCPTSLACSAPVRRPSRCRPRRPNRCRRGCGRNGATTPSGTSAPGAPSS
jgi:nitrate reductase alpha subunit